MGYHKEVILFVVTALAVTNAFLTLVPKDKEIVYKYQTVVKAGTQIPLMYGSVFLMEGKLHIQSDSNSSLVKLTDLTFKLYNGVLDHHEELDTKSVPLPDEFVDITKPFRIVYDTTGKVLGIHVDKTEMVSSINMKKGIASVLQLDLRGIDLSNKVPLGFTTKEPSVYGKVSMLYSIIPRGDIIEIQKMHEMPTNMMMFRDFVTNLRPLHCQAKWQPPITHDCNRKYKLIKQEDHLIVKDVRATGGIYFYPFNAKSDAYFVLVNQTMHMLEMKPIEKRIEVPSDRFEDDMKSVLLTEMAGDIIPDITNGRHRYDFNKIVEDVQKLLMDLIDYVQVNHIHMHTPDIQHGQTVTRLLRKMLKLDRTRLMQFHDTLSRKKSLRDLQMLEVFQQMVPLMGTKAAILFMKELIWQKKVSDDVAIRMLQTMPMHVRSLKFEILTELEDMIKEDQVLSWPVRKAALLSFSILVNRVHNFETFKRDNFMMHLSHSDRESEMMHSTDRRTDELDTKYEKWVLDFVNRLKSTEEYDRRKTYMEVLQNMQLKSITKHLEPAVEGKWFDCRHLRLLAMWAISGSVMDDSERLVELFWPIMANRNEYPELRAAAYYIIMESSPSLTRVANMYWFMQNEKDPELYNFYYTHVRSLMDTKDPCKQQLRTRLRDIMKFLQTPDLRTMSGYYQIDYTDRDYGFAGGMNDFIFSTNKSKIISWTSNSNIMGMPLENYAVVLKICGLEKGLTDVLKVITKSGSKMFSFSDLTEVIKNIPVNKDIRIEGIILKQAFIVHSFFFDHTNIKDINDLLDIINKDQYTYVKNTIDLDFDRKTTMLMPNDIGMPILFDILFPTVTYKTMNMTKEGSDKVINWYVDGLWKEWLHTRQGLSIYNPVVDAWQGVSRYNSFDMTLPVYTDIALNTQQQKMKITWKRHDDDEKNIMGFRSHVATMVFVEDLSEKNFLHQSNPDCRPFALVSHGEEFRRNTTLLEKDDSNTGLRYQMEVFDYEPSLRRVTNGSFLTRLRMLNIAHFKNFRTPLGHMFMTLRNLYSRIILRPIPGMHGLLVKIEPSKQIPATHVDLSLRLNHDIKRDDNLMTPAMTLNGRATYVLKNMEKTIKTWDLTTILEMNTGHTINNLKMQLTRMIPGQKDFKICLEGMKKWTKQGLTGRMNVAMSHSTEAKCSSDETVVDISMTGEESDEQKDEHHVHGDCVYPRTYHVHPDDYTIDCLASFTNIRKYTYIIKTTPVNLPTEFKRTFMLWMDHIKGNYISHYIRVPEHSEEVAENNLKVKVLYPLIDNEVDVEVLGPQEGFRFESLNLRELRWFGMYPDNLYYSDIYRFMHRIGLTDICMVHKDVLHFGRHHEGISHSLTNDWTLYMGDGKTGNKMFAVYIKKVDDKRMAVKIMHESNVMEILPEDKDYKIVVDGQEVQDRMKFLADWVSFFQYPFKKSDALFPADIMLPHVGVHMKFDGTQVKIEVPKSDLELQGVCVGR